MLTSKRDLLSGENLPALRFAGRTTIKKPKAVKPLECAECGEAIFNASMTQQNSTGSFTHWHPHCWVEGDDVADGLEWVISLTQTVLQNIHHHFTSDFVRENAAYFADVVEECWLGAQTEVKRLRRIAATPEAQALVARLNGDES